MNGFRRGCAGGIVGICLSLLVACGGQQRDTVSDLKQYVAALKAELQRPLSASPVASPSLPSGSSVGEAYGARALRSPFQPATEDLRGAQAGSKGPLEIYPLSSYRFVGTLSHKGHIWAIMMTPDAKVYQAKPGDTIGRQQGRIVRVALDRVEVAQEGVDDAGRVTRSLEVILLKKSAKE